MISFSLGKKIAGLHLRLLSDEHIEVSYVVLGSHKGEITLLEQSEYMNMPFPKVLEKLNIDTPVYISLTGKGVIHKIVQGINISDPDDALKKAFPNLPLNEVITQVYQYETVQIISVVRKTTIDQILSLFVQKGIYVLEVVLGPLAVNTYINELSDGKDEIVVYDHQYSLSAQKVISFNHIDQEDDVIKYVDVGNGRIASFNFIAFTTALLNFVAIEGVSGSIFGMEGNRTEWRGKIQFVKVIKYASIAIISILMINALMFFHFSSRHEDLSSQYNFSSSKIAKMESMQKELKEKQGFLKKIGWKGKSKISYYADRLASTVPDEIELTEMQIYPLDMSLSKVERKQIFMNDQIMVKGVCNSPVYFNLWVLQLEKREWVKEIKNQEYSFNPFDKIGQFSFVIYLK